MDAVNQVFHRQARPSGVAVSTRLDTPTLIELNKIAAENDRTLAAEIRRAVRFYLEATDGEVAA